MRSRLAVEVSNSVMRELESRAERTGGDLSALVDGLLSDALGLSRHSLFQVSTSNALVQGVFEGAVSVRELLAHGDFGLGTFAQLDGEMIVLDSVCYRASGRGELSVVDDDTEVPFALVTRFQADHQTHLTAASMQDVSAEIARMRPSDNVFVGIKGEGEFLALSLRAVCRARPGEGLAEVAARQSEFSAREVKGTLVGFWSPEYAQSITIPGFHLHFVSDDRSIGGHVLGFEATKIQLGLHVESDMHLALPENAEFLSADLAGDYRAEIDQAENAREGEAP